MTVCTERLFPEVVAFADELTAIRRDIHAHPEAGFETQRTVALIVDYLKSWGVEAIDTDFLKGAVIAQIQGKQPGHTIALRADIDCLPMNDCSENVWKSQNEGLAHACGHDGHCTWLLGVGRYLAQTRNFPGKVVLVFQPAEELGKGARTLVEAGLIEKFGIEEIYGGHTEPNLPIGTIGFKPGPLQAASDSFYITVSGKGTHGGRPHLGVDPIPVISQIALALQTVVARKVDPMQTCVLSICSMNAGRFETTNVVPHFATMSGTVRTFLPTIQDMVQANIEKMATDIATANGCTAEVKYDRLVKSVLNSEEQTMAGYEATKALLGADKVKLIDAFMSSEDFSEYLAKVPGCIIRVGIRDDEHNVSLHNQAFDFNDKALPVAVSVIANMAITRLRTLAA